MHTIYIQLYVNCIRILELYKNVNQERGMYINN